MDLKTTYRDPDHPGHVNGFTLGSHGAYFRDRSSTKNIQFPYADYAGHFCLGVIYSRADLKNLNETETISVQDLQDRRNANRVGQQRVTTVASLRSITSIIKDFEFFVCEKWQLASDRQGSGNTANIGSITSIEDILNANGVFAKLGEEWFDEYWMNYGRTTMMKKGQATPIRRIEDFLDFKGGDKNLVVSMTTKRKKKRESE